MSRLLKPTATIIMAAEAHRLQSTIQWGVPGTRTAEVEIDVTVVCKWKVPRDGDIVHYYYCYMGARQRGAVEKLALMPMGVVESVGEGRVSTDRNPP